MAQIQAAENFLNQITHIKLDELQKQKTLDVKKLLELDQYLQKRIIQQWLVHHKVAHTLTEAFLNEILRFLHSPRGGYHKLNKHWNLLKKQSTATIITSD